MENNTKTMEVDTEYNFALFSGGNDSLVTTHWLMEKSDYSVDKVVYLDTGIGLQENIDFVSSVCEEFDWPYEIVQTPVSYEEKVKEHGFPGPQGHTYMYIWLKARALAKLNRQDEYYGTRCGLYSGVRKHESRRRMGHVTEKKEGSTFNWYAPLFDKRDEWMDEYREEHDLPENPSYQKIHRSGDCFCGAYATRDEELIDLQAHYPDMYDRIMELEEEVQEELGEKNSEAYWGHGGKNEIDLYFDFDTVGEGIVCSSCGVPGEDAEQGIFDY
jgi:3'-phosphoadenosine 5'-phosphosulfate sulfotransferase (PAPS reductase)/FAD synthetase